MGGAGEEQQALLQRGQRQHVGDLVLPRQFVDLGLSQPRGRDVRRRQPAPAAAHVRADTGQRVEPQPAQPVDLGVIQRRRRPPPVGVQLRAGAGVDGAGVDRHRVHQRHGNSRGNAGQAPSVRGDPPQVVEAVTRRGAQPPQIVEPEQRIRPTQVDIGIQVAQQTVGQRVRHGSQLLFGVLDQPPSSAWPAVTCSQSSRPILSDTGYLVVNQPTVRDKSMSALSSS